MFRRTLLAAVTLFAAALGAAAPATVTLVDPPRAQSGYFQMGTARNPGGHVLTLDSRSLRLDAEPWFPIMGEFHYSRYPAAEWRGELLKMKAGGIDIVSTYVFWIHHEEIQGRWDWSGRRDLRRFVQTAADVGLKVVVRCGPWCHGEVRNGGLPDWVVERKGWKLRSTDPKFLAAVRELYGQIAGQLHGLLWKDGGPVIGIQLDNEYRGPSAYLLALKAIARGVGLDVPLYTRTGWPALTTPMPPGAIVPLYGVYAEGFWDRQLTSMPGNYWAGFQFSALRTDAAIATDMLGTHAAKDAPDVDLYPYLTCEIGGGMMTSYHRRILVNPLDVEATTLVKLAGGSTLLGYYMYHGGTNPDGRRTTLMENQRTLMTNYNDLPVKSYDFQAPLGEFGEVRPQYHLLRRLHLFLHEYGRRLTGMATALPNRRPAGRKDVTTLRWAARSDGRRGFVFVNNYQRGEILPPKTGVQFALRLTDGRTLTFPASPVTVPANAIFWWPFNLDLGGANLRYATAMPVTNIVEASGTRTYFFAASPQLPVEFAFDADRVARIQTTGRLSREGSEYVLRDIPPGRGVAVKLLTTSDTIVQCVVLDDRDSLRLWKGRLAGRSRVFLTGSDLVFDHDQVRVTAAAPGLQHVGIFPDPAEVDVVPGSAGTRKLAGAEDGIFRRYVLPAGYNETTARFEPVRDAGPLRKIPIGPAGVAMEPTDADFAAAAVWRIALPADLDFSRHPLLRFHYVGDVARVYLGGRLLTDSFYNGRTRNLGLWRYASELRGHELRFEVLPLQRHEPIFLEPGERPRFGAAPALAVLHRVDLVETTTTTLTGRPAPEPPLPRNYRTDVAEPPRPRRELGQ